MQRCPCCNARLGGSAVCPRCQTDLGHVDKAQQFAQYHLSESIRYWQEQSVEHSLKALELSLCLNKTELALGFRDFLIHQHCRSILDLLALKQWLSAKRRLYQVRLLMPHSQKLQQLSGFADYLLATHHQTDR